MNAPNDSIATRGPARGAASRLRAALARAAAGANGWWALAIAGAVVAPLSPALLPGRTLSWRDTAIMLEPMRALVAPALRSLSLPLWNPWEGTGQPLFAGLNHSVLHPVSVLSALFDTGIDPYLLGYVAFAAAGTFLAARALGASRAAAAGAASAFALSGYVLGMTCSSLYLAGAASMPWVVAGMRHAASGGGRSILLGGLGALTAVFAGEPQAAICAVAIGAVVAWGRSRARGLLRASAAVTLGLLLGAVQLVPALALLRRSSRLAGLATYASDAQWPLDPPRLFELVSPGLFVGRIRDWSAPVFAWLGTPAEKPIPWAPSVYVGLAVILLAALAARRTRDGRRLLLLAALFTWLAMGAHLGATRALSWVPVWNLFRYAEKLVAPLTLCLALAAGLGIDRVRRAPGFPRLAAAAGAASLAILLAALAWSPATATGPAQPLHAARAVLRAHLIEGLTHAALVAALVAALAFGARRLGRALAPALAALLYLEGAAAAPFAIHLGSAEVAAACPPRPEAPLAGARLQLGAVTNALPAATVLDPIDALPEKWARVGLPPMNVRCGVESLAAYTSFEPVRTYYTILDPMTRAVLGPRFAATHVVSEAATNREDAALLATATRGGTLLDQRGGISIWSVPHRPWASFAPAVRPARGLDDAVKALQREVLAGGDAVVVEGVVGSGALGGGEVLNARKGPERIELDAVASADGVLVVADAWDPGWTAELDGAKVPLLPADVLLRAVPFPAGRHRLVMRYAPLEVRVGAALSLLGLLAAAAGAFLFRRRSAIPVESGGPSA